MNHNDWLRAIYAIQKSNLVDFSSPTVFKATCSALAFHGDYATGTDVCPSWTTVAKLAGVSRTTAYKVRDWLLEHGWLKHERTLESNIAVYSLTEGVVHSEKTTDQQSLLETTQAVVQSETEQLSNEQEQLSSQSGHNTTTNTNNLDTKRETTLRAVEDGGGFKDSPLLVLDTPLPLTEGGTPSMESLNREEEDMFDTTAPLKVKKSLESSVTNSPTADTQEEVQPASEAASHAPEAKKAALRALFQEQDGNLSERALVGHIATAMRDSQRHPDLALEVIVKGVLDSEF